MNNIKPRPPFPSSDSLSVVLSNHSNLHIKQIREVAELFGFETRNQYHFLSPGGEVVLRAAEKSKGFLGWVARQFLGHWRPFEIAVADPAQNLVLNLKHPFRIFFQRLEVYSADGKYLGGLQQRFAILKKRFDVQDSSGNTLLEMTSAFWKPWTFPFISHGKQVALIKKKWSGLLKEGFTDADNFTLDFESAQLSLAERILILSSSLFIDLQYFEKKAGN